MSAPNLGVYQATQYVLNQLPLPIVDPKYPLKDRTLDLFQYLGFAITLGYVSYGLFKAVRWKLNQAPKQTLTTIEISSNRIIQRKVAKAQRL